MSEQRSVRNLADTLQGLPEPSRWSAERPEEAFDLHFEGLPELLGDDRVGYRNHCLRVFGNTRALDPTLDPAPVLLALVFHDLGLWTHGTVDYIDPSIEVARAHLERVGPAE